MAIHWAINQAYVIHSKVSKIETKNDDLLILLINITAEHKNLSVFGSIAKVFFAKLV